MTSRLRRCRFGLAKGSRCGDAIFGLAKGSRCGDTNSGWRRVRVAATQRKKGRGYGENAQGTTLRDVGIGQTATVRRLTGEGAIKRHIMDMGITKGVDVYVRKVAPLGDPIEVTVRGYELSLRKSEAACILVG